MEGKFEIVTCTAGSTTSTTEFGPVVFGELTSNFVLDLLEASDFLLKITNI